MTNQRNYWTAIFKRRQSRRHFLRMAAEIGAGYAGLSLIGCGGEEASPERAGGAAAKTPKYGGILRWFNPGPLPDLDPYETGGRMAPRAILGVIYDWLVVYDFSGDLTSADGKIVPRLAESWTMSDSVTYVFKMRQGVKWHDGTDFTSADVKFSYEYIMDKQNNLPGRSVLDAVNKIEAPDKDTLKITLKRPSAGFLSLLTNDSVLIAPKHLMEKDRRGLAMKPVGTGPFMVDKFEPDNVVNLKKNPNFYVKGKPYLDGMTVALINDWSAKGAAFMSKEIDVHVLPNKPEYEAIKAVVPDLQLRSFFGVSNNTFFFNYTRPLFKDIRVRKAIQLAIDHKGLLDRIYSGEGTINPPVISGAWTPWAIPQEELLEIPGWRQPKTQDIAEAKRLLVEAGYPNGLKIVGICNTEASTVPKNFQVVADQLRAIGITMENQCSERTTERKRAQALDFDVDFYGYSSFSEDPDRRLFPYVYTDGSANYGKLSDSKLDEMIDKQTQILVEQERRKVMLDIQRYMIEQAYHVPTPDPFFYGIMHSYVRGYDPAYMGVAHPHLRSEAEEIWLDK